ncbi:MAG TPA: TlpA disulfide reductase family protein [Ureibacillus sp.]|nr:TlpA disulfide reductase family protein [Ureibacillus sp.]
MKLRSQMPDLKGEAAWLNGKVQRTDLIGEKPTIIHFWSISCYDCKVSMPQVNELRDKYENQANFLAVHMPRSKEDTEISRIRKVASNYNISQPIFVDNQMTLTDTFNNQFVPSYYLFDRKGMLRHFQSGGSGMKMLEKRLLKLLNE